MPDEVVEMGSTIATATNNEQGAPANSTVEQSSSRKEAETTPSNSATSTAVSSFWSGKTTKTSSSGKEKEKTVVDLVIGDSEELTDQSDDDDDVEDMEDRSQVFKDLKEEDDENEYQEILRRKSMCQNCERDGRANCALAPRIGRYPRCIRCRDKDWRCSFLPMKNGEYAPSHRKSHGKPHFPIDVDVKPVIPKDPPAKIPRGPGRPPKPKNAQAGPSKPSISTARSVPYDRNLRPHHPPSSTFHSKPSTSFRLPPSRGIGSNMPNSSPLANRSASSASTLLRRAANNALAAEERPSPQDDGNNSQLLDALSKMSRALRLSSEAFQLLADYQRGKPPNNGQDGKGNPSMMLE